MPSDDFPKGAFHVSHEKDAKWDEGLREHFAYRDLGMISPMGARVRAHVIRPVGTPRVPGSSIHHRVLEYSADYTVIEITMPADFETVTVAP